MNVQAKLSMKWSTYSWHWQQCIEVEPLLSKLACLQNHLLVCIKWMACIAKTWLCGSSNPCFAVLWSLLSLRAEPWHQMQPSWVSFPCRVRTIIFMTPVNLNWERWYHHSSTTCIVAELQGWGRLLTVQSLFQLSAPCIGQMHYGLSLVHHRSLPCLQCVQVW
jgi:hypothetical protein